MATATPGAPLIVFDFQRSYGTHWTTDNAETIYDWVTVASYNMQCLEEAALYHRKIMRNSTILALILSTFSGTICVTLFGIKDETLSLSLNGFVAVFSFAVAIFTGYVQIYQLQERLEQFLKLKYDWTVFSTVLASELQLPIDLRRDALYIITKNKQIYLELLKRDCEIPVFIQKKVRKAMGKHLTDTHIDMEISMLPDTVLAICRKTVNDSKLQILEAHKSSPNMYVMPKEKAGKEEKEEKEANPPTVTIVENDILAVNQIVNSPENSVASS